MPISPPSRTRWAQAARETMAALVPPPVQVGLGERWRAMLGALLGVLLSGLLARWLGGAGSAAWLVAPIGASAVLVFAVPASPMAQPWAVVGGNTVSALIGIACLRWIPDPALAASLAVGLAIGAMFMLRCLHPPGGASALLMVLSHVGNFEFALYPVLCDSLLLVAAGMAYNTLTGRAYPHRRPLPEPAQHASERARFSAADLDVALREYNQVLDVSRDDLESLLHHAEAAAYRRTLGELRCRDIMSRDLATVQFGTPLDEAWRLMRERRIKSLPVIDRVGRIVGIVTPADFLRQVGLDLHTGLGERLRSLVRATPTVTSDKPEVVGQIMTRSVRVTSEDRHALDLMPLFSEGGHHHIPVIDSAQRLVGVITQSDLVRVLHRSLPQPTAS